MEGSGDMAETPDMASSQDMPDDQEDMPGTDPDQDNAYSLSIVSPEDGKSIDPEALVVSLTLEPSPPEGAEVVLVVDDFIISREDASEGMASLTLAPKNISHLRASSARQLTARLEKDEQVLAESEAISIRLSREAVKLELLFERSEGEPRVEYDGGRVSLIRANVPIQASDSVERAFTFLEEYDALLDLPGDLRENYYIKEVTRDDRGIAGSGDDPLEVVQLRQRAHGVPVYLTDITTVMRGERVLFSSGQWLEELPEMPTTYLGMSDVFTAIEDDFFKVSRILPPRQFFYDASLDWDPAEGKRPESNPRLAWRASVFGQPRTQNRPSLYLVWVDAITGDILEVQDTADDLSVKEDDPDVVVIDYGNDEIDICALYYSGYWWAGGGTEDCDENGCNGGAHPDSVAIQEHSLLMYDWTLLQFFWYSFDNHNQKIRSYTRAKFDGNTIGAYYPWCEYMGFKSGETSARLFGHEYMHAFAHHTIDMEDSYTATVVNEALANVFGAFYTGHKDSRMYSCYSNFDRAHEGVEPGVYSPGCNVDPDDQTTYYADHISEYDRNRSYYYNTGIALRAISMGMRGGKHLDSNVLVDRPVGDPLPAVRAFHDLVALHMIPSNAGMTRFLTIWREYVMTQPHSLNQFDACALINGVAAVGVGTGDLDCDQILDDLDDDIDGDYIPNDQDNCPSVRNSDQYDTDGDTLGNACDSDEDGDGIPNTRDNCDQSNPTQTDRDEDGVGDACQDDDGDTIPDSFDNCPEIATNTAGNEDPDGDGFGNACDDDDDGDGVLDTEDNCPLDRNASQDDIDNDGVGRACDNCVGTPNADQANNDNDRSGDACDDDDDNDRVRDVVDNCPFDANPGQEDGDGNGIGYACDPAEQGSYWEAHFGQPAEIAIQVVEAWGQYAMPLPFCTKDCEAYLEPGTLWIIEMIAQVPFAALLFNDEGEMIAIGEPGANGVTQIVFAPDQTFYSLTNPQGAFEPGAYTIMFIPDPAFHTYGDTFSMTLAVTPSQNPIGYSEVCGNKSIGGDEICDGDDLAGQTCQSRGFTAGDLACSTSCDYDTSACTTCSNNTSEPGEVCDGTDVNGQTCQDLGYPGGTLTCNASCSGLDTSGCQLCDPFSTTDCTQDEPCRSDGTCGLCTDNSECTAPFVCYNNKCQLF